MNRIIMPSGKIITPDALFVRHRYARNNLDVETPTLAAEGRFKFIIRRADGSIRQETEWSKNLILDVGLDQFMSNGQINIGEVSGAFKVGTGTTAPAVNQTTLVAQVASSTQSAATLTTSVASSAAPWWAGRRYSGRFAIGQLNGQALTEVGWGWSTTACFSRALITPDGVNPGSITVLIDESLDVYYELRFFPNTTDATGVVVLNGNNYNFTLRPSRLNTIGGNGFADMVTGYSDSANSWGLSGTITDAAETATLGAVTAGLAGSNYAAQVIGTLTRGTYTNGSFQRTHSRQWALNQINTTSGDIQGLEFGTAGIGRYQMVFSPKIPKGPTRTLRLDFNTTMARRP